MVKWRENTKIVKKILGIIFVFAFLFFFAFFSFVLLSMLPRGIGRNKLQLPEKRSLGSSMMPNPKRSRPNETTQLGESWSNLWVSQSSQPIASSPPSIEVPVTPKKLPLQPKLPPKPLALSKAKPLPKVTPNNPPVSPKQVYQPNLFTGKQLSPSKLPYKNPPPMKPTPAKPVISIPTPVIKPSPPITESFQNSLDTFDDIDIEDLPLDMQNSLFGTVSPPSSKSLPIAREHVNTPQIYQTPNIPQTNLPGSSPTDTSQIVKVTPLSDVTNSVQHNNLPIQCNSVKHTQSSSPPEEITMIPLQEKLAGDPRFSRIKKFDVNGKNTQKNQSPPSPIEEIQCSPNTSNHRDIALVERYNIQNKRLQMIVDILSESDSDIRSKVEVAQFPATKMEELKKKLKRYDKEKIRYRAELKKSEEERQRLFNELRDSIKKQEEYQLKYEEERKKVKNLQSLNRKYTERVKALTQTLKTNSALHSAIKERQVSEATGIRTKPLRTSKVQKSLSEGNCSIIDELDAAFESSPLPVPQPKNIELLHAMETFINHQGTRTSDNRSLLISWLNSQVDDVNADPQFQEETTKQAFARVEKL